ncbi:MAG: flagellar transcriptional regulator FlhD [Burkholderiales bacterium]|uniref:flagellar transcriptional regulator FlhD n=1 Tax=Inhella sp. TaxID=1921806 RepID=UPI001AC46CA9|nr:flagellar transcriptional regulator FlhD [Burkholderiales bacterium]
MTPEQILAEIRETNLSYLMLAQSLIRADREQALYRLGVSEETATLLAQLSPAQVQKLAASSTLLCRFRMEDDLVWSLLTSRHKPAVNDQSAQLHAQILMAGRHAQSL